MKLLNYVKNVNEIIEDEIDQQKYVETTEYTYNESKRFQDFLTLGRDETMI